MDHFEVSKDLGKGSPFHRGLVYYNSFSRKNHGNCARCSICASMYIKDRKPRSYVDQSPKVVKQTDMGLYITIMNIQKVPSKLKKCLCYGSAIFHTDRVFDRKEHVRTQRALLHDSFSILQQKLVDTRDLEQVIIYIEINNGFEKCKYAKGLKVTHPHVWIMESLPDYGGLYHSDTPDPNEDQIQFMDNHLIFADSLFEINPKSNLYLKFFIDLKYGARIVKSEIDMTF